MFNMSKYILPPLQFDLHKLLIYMYVVPLNFIDFQWRV